MENIKKFLDFLDETAELIGNADEPAVFVPVPKSLFDRIDVLELMAAENIARDEARRALVLGTAMCVIG